jgi:uncharacterized membrane protein YccC
MSFSFVTSICFVPVYTFFYLNYSVFPVFCWLVFSVVLFRLCLSDPFFFLFFTSFTCCLLPSLLPQNWARVHPHVAVLDNSSDFDGKCQRTMEAVRTGLEAAAPAAS